MAIRHIVDPTFFDDALAEFDDEYTVYVAGNLIIDDYGNQKRTYSAHKIRGSLQSEEKRINKSANGGNTYQWQFQFYCKSSYPIDIHDYLLADGKLLLVTGVTCRDEAGVRWCSLEMTNLADPKDLEKFNKFEDGRLQR